MSWISGNCQDDRNFSCYYSTFDTWEDFCIDSDSPCFDIYDNAGLVKVVDHRAPSGGGW